MSRIRTGRGYTKFTAEDINNANPMKLGVKLGRACVKRDIPVKDVAEYLGLSRTTIYAWFLGKADVSVRHVDKVEKLIEKLA
jgi:transcriptional regulator with XRE-family HTH domain